MAVTRTARILKFTANADQFVGRLHIDSIRFEGTGLTPGDKLILQDINGSLVAEHIVMVAIEDAPILESGSLWKTNGLKINSVVAGAWTVLVYLR